MLETKAVKTKFRKRTFSYTGPKLRNALPLHIREEDNIVNFKQKAKKLLFEGTAKFLENAFITTWIFSITAHLSSREFHSENGLYKYDIIITIIIVIIILMHLKVFNRFYKYIDISWCF